MLRRSGYAAKVRESSQERVAIVVVVVVVDERLDQELSCFPREEGPDPVDDVHGKTVCSITDCPVPHRGSWQLVMEIITVQNI